MKDFESPEREDWYNDHAKEDENPSDVEADADELDLGE